MGLSPLVERPADKSTGYIYKVRLRGLRISESPSTEPQQQNLCVLCVLCVLRAKKYLDRGMAPDGGASTVVHVFGPWGLR